MKPTSDMFKSTAEFPEPKDLTGVWSGHGLINQFGHFHLKHPIMAQLQDILLLRDKFQWTPANAKSLKL